jgi:hypothetical protein
VWEHYKFFLEKLLFTLFVYVICLRSSFTLFYSRVGNFIYNSVNDTELVHLSFVGLRMVFYLNSKLDLTQHFRRDVSNL